MTAFPALFSPLAVRGLVLRNRVVMAPMSSDLGNADGTVSDRQVAYYRARARGGTGLITVEYTCVEPAEGRARGSQLVLTTQAQADSHRPLVEVIKAEGAAAFLQLQHSGRAADPRANGGRQPMSPSPLRMPSGTETRAMTGDDIARVIDGFARAARFAVAAGYDGIELHAAHSYLIQSFLSPFTNRRDDAWGGDAERRLRFPIEVIRAVRAELGDRPLCYRFSVEEFVEGGLHVEDSERLAPRLVAAGADMLHASAGIREAMERVIEPMSAEEGNRLPLARRLRAAVPGVPVTAVGQIRRPAMAEAAILRGDCDLVALGRPMLADPDWAAKAAAGRVDEIVPCTSCNWCYTRHGDKGGIGCAENPRTGHETEPPPPASGGGRPVAVVGGGPGGMAAAVMLARTGFAPVLFERDSMLGGGLVASSLPPFKDKLGWYLDYLKRELARARVDVRCGTRATADSLAAFPAAILAPGAQQRAPDFSVEGGRIEQAYDVLMRPDWRPAFAGEHIVVYGGGETGCETAEFCADRGARITLISRSPQETLARNAEPAYRRALVTRLTANPRVTLLCGRRVLRLRPGELDWSAGEETGRLPHDRLFLAQGRDAGSPLAEELARRGVEVHLIGDGRAVRRIGDAVHDAWAAVGAMATEPGRAAKP